MNIKYTALEYEQAKSKDLLSLQCYQCSNIFQRTKKYIKHELKTKKGECRFCSHQCYHKFKTKKQKVSCKNCDTEFDKTAAEIKKSPNHFCTKSCAATYNNTHKTHGTRRSKLERWLEQQLPIFYSGLTFSFNQKDVINSEIDIFIPSLKLAFELNGIFHYEPIYGTEKLQQIRNNDQRKFQACLERGIELCIIDTSSFGYFKELRAKKYLDIITEIINQKLSNS